MDEAKKKEITDRYAEWVNLRDSEGLMFQSPFRLMTFTMWVGYNVPEHKADVEELHKYLCEHYDYANKPEFNGFSFDPWID